MGMAFVKARCTHIPLVLICLSEMQLSVVKSRSALSPLASCSCKRKNFACVSYLGAAPIFGVGV